MEGRRRGNGARARFRRGICCTRGIASVSGEVFVPNVLAVLLKQSFAAKYALGGHDHSCKYSVRSLSLSPLFVLATLACAGPGAAPRADSARVASPADAVVAASDVQARCEMVEREGGPCILLGPSLIELIARPELYDGKRVRVIGFVNFEFEGNAIYLSREDWEQGINRNGVWVDPDLALPAGVERDTTAASYRPNRRYALLEGTFHAGRGGHFGMWSGSIDRVTRLQSWGTNPEPAPVARQR